MSLTRLALGVAAAALFASGAALPVAAQQTPPRISTDTTPSPPANPADVATMDAILRSLYDVISGPPGKARDWTRFRSLFIPGGRLIPSGVRPDGSAHPRVLTPEDYAANVGPRLEQMGFFEREASRHVDTYGVISQVFSTYESRHAASDPTPFARGINSIQLLNDGKRWWIVTVYWDSERPNNPIPAQYLKQD